MTDARTTPDGVVAHRDHIAAEAAAEPWSPTVDLARLDGAYQTRDALDGVLRAMRHAIDALAPIPARGRPAETPTDGSATGLHWSAGDRTLSHETIRHANGRMDAALRLKDRKENRRSTTTVVLEHADHPAVHPDPRDPVAAARRLLDVLAAIAAAPFAAKDATAGAGTPAVLPAPMLAAALRVAEASGSHEVETASATPFSTARVDGGGRRWWDPSRDARTKTRERVDADMPRDCSVVVEQSTPMAGDRSVTVLIGPVVHDVDLSGVPHLEALRILAAHPAPSTRTPDRNDPYRMDGTAASTSHRHVHGPETTAASTSDTASDTADPEPDGTAASTSDAMTGPSAATPAGPPAAAPGQDPGSPAALPPRGSTPDRPIILQEGHHTTPDSLRIMLGRIAELRSIVADAVDSATKPETATTDGRVSHAGFTTLDGRVASHQEGANSHPGLHRRALISTVPTPTFSIVFDRCSNDVGRPSRSDRRKGAEDLLDAVGTIVRDAIAEGVPFDPDIRRPVGDGVTGLPRELDLIAIGHALEYDAHAHMPSRRILGGRRIVNVATPNPMSAQRTSSTYDDTIEYEAHGIASAVRVVVEVDDIGRPNRVTVEPVIHHVALAAIDPVETLRAVAAHAEHLARHRANPSDPS